MTGKKNQSHMGILYKKCRKKSLSLEEKKHNKKLISIKRQIENKIKKLKIFKIISYLYGDFQKKYHIPLNSTVGLMNLKYDF